MKQKLSPIIAVVAILVAIGAAALTWTKFGRVSQADPGAVSGGMPPEAQAEFQKRLGSGPQTGGVAPGTLSGGTAPAVSSPGGIR